MGERVGRDREIEKEEGKEEEGRGCEHGCGRQVSYIYPRLHVDATLAKMGFEWSRVKVTRF